MDLRTARGGALRRFQHEKGAGAAGDQAGGVLAREDGREAVAAQITAELEEQQHVAPLGVVGAADEHQVGLAGGNAGMGRADRVDAGLLLAHEGARRAGDAMDDGDVAGEQVGELGEKQCRPQPVHQPLVEKARGCVALRLIAQDRRVHRKVALAAAGSDDHVHAREDLGAALDARAVEREARGVGADALPGFHLALIALLGNLRVE